MDQTRRRLSPSTEAETAGEPIPIPPKKGAGRNIRDVAAEKSSKTHKAVGANEALQVGGALGAREPGREGGVGGEEMEDKTEEGKDDLRTEMRVKGVCATLEWNGPISVEGARRREESRARIDAGRTPARRGSEACRGLDAIPLILLAQLV